MSEILGHIEWIVVLLLVGTLWLGVPVAVAASFLGAHMLAQYAAMAWAITLLIALVIAMPGAGDEI